MLMATLFLMTPNGEYARVQRENEQSRIFYRVMLGTEENEQSTAVCNPCTNLWSNALGAGGPNLEKDTMLEKIPLEICVLLHSHIHSVMIPSTRCL